VADPSGSQQAASQDWPAFVLVAGLLLVGAVASETGIFVLAGSRLAGRRLGELTRFACVALLVGVTSALLNLDTAAAFLTPVLVHMTRARRHGEALVLYGSLLLCNAGSVLLPGSNLTNIIVVGHLRVTGGRFFLTMAPAWILALLVTAVVVALAHRHDLRPATDPPGSGAEHHPAGAPGRDALWLGLMSVVSAATAVVVFRNAAVPVLVIGALAVCVALLRRHLRFATATRTVDVPVLAGLLGIAIALGTLGRSWDGPAMLLAHCDAFATAGLAAVTSVILNNLPAASILAARIPLHPYSLLVGLDIGPNLFVTGSLSALLWYRSARTAGAEPSIRHVTKIGLVAAPLAGIAALGMLSAASTR
jgi:arsenical pump membrane protein